MCTQCQTLMPVPHEASYFDLLGLQRTFAQDDARLATAFRAISRKIHPDRFAHGTEDTRLLATRLSAAVNHAYEVLKNPVRRAGYLLELAGGPDGSEMRDVPGNLLAGPFGQADNTLDVHGPILEPRLLSDGQRQYGYAASHEPVPVIAGECYWLEISNASLFESQWQWANSAFGDGRALQDGGLENVPDGYSDVDAVVEDMAFLLSVPLSTDHDCYLAPDNDFCSDSQPIEEGFVSFDTTGATTDGPPVPLRSVIPTSECGFPLGDGQINSDIWFDFVATCSGLLTINLCESQFDAKIAIYESGDCAELGVPIACNDDACGDDSGRQSALVVRLDDEADLKIRVGGYDGATGPGVIDLSFLIAPPPIVDVFDYSKFAACFTGPCPAAPCDLPLYAPRCCQAQDYEVDGDVDLEDFVKFHQALISPASAEGCGHHLWRQAAERVHHLSH
ncbi:MAG: DnaJ domain-containing protein [Planctomycetes bacterium]|nr:DnaJ domain-containing protein [Planctomycetota bacterium]